MQRLPGSIFSWLSQGLPYALSLRPFASIIHAKTDVERAIADKISLGISSAATVSVHGEKNPTPGCTIAYIG